MTTVLLVTAPATVLKAASTASDGSCRRRATRSLRNGACTSATPSRNPAARRTIVACRATRPHRPNVGAPSPRRAGNASARMTSLSIHPSEHFSLLFYLFIYYPIPSFVLPFVDLSSSAGCKYVRYVSSRQRDGYPEQAPFLALAHRAQMTRMNACVRVHHHHSVPMVAFKLCTEFFLFLFLFQFQTAALTGISGPPCVELTVQYSTPTHYYKCKRKVFSARRYPAS